MPEEIIREVKRQLESRYGPMSTWSPDLRSGYYELRVEISRSTTDINKLLRPFGIKLML